MSGKCLMLGEVDCKGAEGNFGGGDSNVPYDHDSGYASTQLRKHTDCTLDRTTLTACKLYLNKPGLFFFFPFESTLFRYHA